MPCLIVLVLLGLPRAALLLAFLFSDYLGRAFETNFWPFLGFFLMPVTTLAWAVAVNSWGGVSGVGAALVLLGVLIDLGLLRGGTRRGPPQG
jgi:hypothetical protein